MDQLSVSAAAVSRSQVVRRTAVTQVPLNLVFFGPPGAGKGTQADRFAERHQIPKISTGDILRKAIQDGTRIGVLVRDTLQRGALVGDDLIISIVAERLEQPDTAQGFVLDGFPRTLAAGRGARNVARRPGRRSRDRAGGARRRSHPSSRGSRPSR